MLVLSKGDTGMNDRSYETGTEVVMKTEKTQASPTWAQLSLLQSHVGDVNASAFCETATDV